MKVTRYIDYLARLRAIIGPTAACTFVVTYIFHKIFPSRRTALARIPVGPYRFYFPSISFFTGLFSEIFLNETYYLAPTQQSLRAIDCGANIGVSLLYIKVRAPHARVLCFEPNPAAMKVLERNIAANRWGGEVQVLAYALGKEDGQAQFYVDAAEATSSSGGTVPYQKNKKREVHSYPVEVRKLSRFITEPVDLLKIDIEGGESDVLEELRSADKLKLVKATQLEYHYIPGFVTKRLSEVLALLEGEGFTTFVSSPSLPHEAVGRDALRTSMVFAWRDS